MATDSWNSIDEFSHSASEHYCAFLDIVGYKDKADKYFDCKFNLLGRFKRALSISLGLVKMTSMLVDVSMLKVRFFSDSIVLTLPKKSNGNDTLFGLINTCKILSAHLSFEELYVRGGISVGLHEEFIDNQDGFEFLASIALEKAYMLESKHAIYPRILVDENILPHMSSDAKMMLAKDGDDLIVHFAPQLINQDGGNQQVILSEMIEMKSIMMKAEGQRVKDKYQWLLDYYYWTLETTRNVELSLFNEFKPKEFKAFRLL